MVVLKNVSSMQSCEHSGRAQIREVCYVQAHFQAAALDLRARRIVIRTPFLGIEMRSDHCKDAQQEDHECVDQDQSRERWHCNA